MPARGFWTAERVAYLREHHATMLKGEIAKHLGCSKNAVTGKAWRLGLRLPAAEWARRLASLDSRERRRQAAIRWWAENPEARRRAGERIREVVRKRWANHRAAK